MIQLFMLIEVCCWNFANIMEYYCPMTCILYLIFVTNHLLCMTNRTPHFLVERQCNEGPMKGLEKFVHYNEVLLSEFFIRYFDINLWQAIGQIRLNRKGLQKNWPACSCLSLGWPVVTHFRKGTKWTTIWCLYHQFWSIFRYFIDLNSKWSLKMAIEE